MSVGQNSPYFFCLCKSALSFSVMKKSPTRRFFLGWGGGADPAGRQTFQHSSFPRDKDKGGEERRILTNCSGQAGAVGEPGLLGGPG